MILLHPKDALEAFHLIEKDLKILCDVTPVGDKIRIQRLIKKK